MRKELIETFNAFRIAIGAVLSLLAGYMLDDDLILAFLLFLIGVGFLSVRIDAIKKEREEE